MNAAWNNGDGCWGCGLPASLPAGLGAKETCIFAHRTHLWHPGSEALEVASVGPPHLWCPLAIPQMRSPASSSSLNLAPWVSRKDMSSLTEKRKRRSCVCSQVERAETVACRQQLLSSGNFADSTRVEHDVTGSLAWPEQHGVPGS